jgi:hypothetical protein
MVLPGRVKITLSRSWSTRGLHGCRDTPAPGPAGQKRHVLSAVTDQYSLFYLGRRDLASFRKFGILPGCTGIAVHDRYQNYFHPDWKHLAGHQICVPTCCGTSPTPPSATPTRTGPSRRNARCAD